MTSEKTTLRFGNDTVSIHHAYLISGDREEAIGETMRFLEHIKDFELRRNPDLHIERFDGLSIEDARRIKTISERKALGTRRVFILAFNRATHEAQNSLLKLIEEPAAGTHFFLVVPREETVLPTVRSRMLVIRGESALGGETGASARAFLSSTNAQRLASLKELLDEISDETSSKEQAGLLVAEIEHLLWRGMREKALSIEPAVFDDVALAKKYISDRAASIKLIMEHLALVLPRISL